MHPFQYQGGNFIIADNVGDTDYFQLIMPGIMDVQGNKVRILEACNTINQEIKVVKCIIAGGESVWLTTEILLDQTPEIDSIMPRLLNILHGARLRFQQEMR